MHAYFIYASIAHLIPLRPILMHTVYGRKDDANDGIFRLDETADTTNHKSSSTQKSAENAGKMEK